MPWVFCWYELYRIFTLYDVWHYLDWKFYAFLFEYWFLFFCFPITLLFQYTQVWIYNNERYKPLLKNGGYLKGEKTF